MPRPDDLTLPPLTGFSGNEINRMAYWRGDEAALEAALDSPHARFVVLVEDHILLRSIGAAWHGYNSRDDLLALAPEIEIAADMWRNPIFLGVDPKDQPIFALAGQKQNNNSTPIPLPPQLKGAKVEGLSLGVTGAVLAPLRPVADHGLLSRADLALLSCTKSLLHWHQRHRFCAQCGQPTQARQGGWRRDCAACEASHFPRTDPVVIMLAYHEDYCLMGRQPRFPAGMYSALAGFLEPGETIEEAVRREIMEEAGLAIGRVDYIASQPWPFPASLMIGCFAQALSTEVHIDTLELEDARWFSRQEVQQILAGTHDSIISPRPTAIAHTLMLVWSETIT